MKRILEYSSLEKEPLEEGKIKPNSDWPAKGAIRFDNVSFSYAKNTPIVLSYLSFEIKAGEKIGIVGRTGKFLSFHSKLLLNDLIYLIGAGKSSIIAAVFRLAEPDGNIYIDNINIKDIGLHALRNKLSIIPVK